MWKILLRIYHSQIILHLFPLKRILYLFSWGFHGDIQVRTRMEGTTVFLVVSAETEEQRETRNKDRKIVVGREGVNNQRNE